MVYLHFFMFLEQRRNGRKNKERKKERMNDRMIVEGTKINKEGKIEGK